MFEHVVPNVYAKHEPLDPEQEPQQPPSVMQERDAGHVPDADIGMKLAVGHVAGGVMEVPVTVDEHPVPGVFEQYVPQS